MARPRWHGALPQPGNSLWKTWDRFVALWAALNLLVVIVDLTYVPLRPFWLQRTLYPFPPTPLAVPSPLPPELARGMDRLKGIEPHRETRAFSLDFQRVDASLRHHPAGQPLSASQRGDLAGLVQLSQQMIDTDPFQASAGSGTLEKIKNRLRQRADQDSSKAAAALLLSPQWLLSHAWEEERQFWRRQILPLVEQNYWRSVDENGRPTDRFWQLDLLLFQSVFLLDILLRAIRLRRKVPGLSWRDALLRRWIDWPLLLPFWRWLRVVPVLERLQSGQLINLEPLRAAISRGVVALFALELFEVLALQIMDGVQQQVRSARWPMRLRALRSHQTVTSQEEKELVELVRLWAPLLLERVAPRLAPELQSVLGHALQQSMQRTLVPAPLRQLQPLVGVEQGFSRQLAQGVVDSLLDLSKSAGARLGRRDDEQLRLLQHFIDRFWEELASALEDGPALERSQDLICAGIERVKRTYLSQFSRAGIEGLIDELDQLMSGDDRVDSNEETAPSPGGRMLPPGTT
ncbi:MAG: hypothetical protein VKO44_03130 [Cyanobacteriota bacterium]|nr:hypothetical protein [Cyanobacteriota bacterium]